MSVEEYLKNVTEQIRCRQAREAVKEEMEGHLEDQMEECMKMGLSREEAENFAVEQMGDPVEVGISLDRVHQPKIAWSMIFLITFLSILGLGVQYFISTQCENVQSFSIISQLGYMAMGFVVLAIMYYLDYSFFGTYGKYIAIVFLGYMFLQIFFLGTEVNGAIVFSGEMNFSLRVLIMCFIPMYAGVLYSYRGAGRKGILKSFLFLVFPVWLTMEMPCLSMALVLFFTLLIMLSVAIQKKWFGESGRKLLYTLWGMTLLCPPLFIVAGCKMKLFADYQIERLQSLISRDTLDENGSGYEYYRIREIIGNSKMVGAGEECLDTSTVLPQVGSDFIITHLISYYGILAGLLVVGLLAFLVFKIFHISLHQKNQLGMMIGMGCGSIFGIQIVLYFLENIGLLPYSYLYLPLFSLGGTGMVVTYFLLGIVLSVYKYQDIPLKVKQKKIIIKI
ncbi:MAG: FtsW/RodA/SpoVE family cell cycle protein [Lachnospiraceae bacterium]|nr:FtsW/RodA/SpoVE family cell cycle protein [Lachnospiraceae bacterium]